MLIVRANVRRSRTLVEIYDELLSRPTATRAAVHVQGTQPLIPPTKFYDGKPWCGNCAAFLTSEGLEPRPNASSDQEAAYHQLFVESGKLGIPARFFLGSLVAGGRSVRSGGKLLTYNDGSSLLRTCLAVKEEFLQFADGVSWGVKRRRVQKCDHRGCREHPPTVLVYPLIRGWSFSATLAFDANVLSVGTLQKLIEVAGESVGLGRWRPRLGGRNGTYRVLRVEAGHAA